MRMRRPAGADWGLESCPALRIPIAAPVCVCPCCRADAKGGQRLEKSKGGWIGSLQPGPNPPPADYPLDCCSWGVYVRFHGSEGRVGEVGVRCGGECDASECR